MAVRHVLVDQDYFIVVELLNTDTVMKIHSKESLQTLTCMVDLQEPRNLIVCDELVLYFDSVNKCTYVKNMLELNKQT